MINISVFVAIPFTAELNFFFLYLQSYLSTKHGLRVERGDHRISTRPVLEKIKRQIQDADVILGDITGRNPNVFYELGLADAYGKKILLMTADPVEEAPMDVRHLEFIIYDLSHHEDFLARLDNAIHNLLVDRYERLFNQACELLRRFNKAQGTTHVQASQKQFQATVIRWEARTGIPDEHDGRELAAFLLPKIVADPADTAVLKSIDAWLEDLRRKFATRAPDVEEGE